MKGEQSVPFLRFLFPKMEDLRFLHLSVAELWGVLWLAGSLM